MPDGLDTGRLENETEEMRVKREAVVGASPEPQFFKLRGELVKQGRTGETVADTGNMWVNLKIYAGGGENGLHNHTAQDHFHLVLSGSARFFGPRGETRDCGQYEGIMLPKGKYYKFFATSEEPLVMIRVGNPSHDKMDAMGGPGRTNIDGSEMRGDSKENKQVPVKFKDGVFFGD